MNVKKLIKELNKFPDDFPVWCTAEGGHVLVSVDWIAGVGNVNDRNFSINSTPHIAVLLGED